MPVLHDFPSSVSRIGIAFNVFKTLLATSLRIVISPFKGSNGARSYFMDVAFAAMRTHLRDLTLDQDRYLNGTTDPVYMAYATRCGFEPQTLALPNGVKAHWLGNPNANKVFVFFHGGGYVLPLTDGHLNWLDDLRKPLGPDTAVLILAYDLAPEAVYPAQLRQAVELIRHLVETEGRSPANIVVGGDSAGGNLVLGLMSHLAHPHPDIAALNLPSKINGTLLISPWSSLTNTQTPSFAINSERDFLTPSVLTRWASAFLGSNSPFAGDFYSEPVLAASDWWAPVADVVDEVFIWAGGNEVLLDGIEALAHKFTLGFGGNGGYLRTIVTPKACHEEMVLERVIGYKGDAGTGSQDLIKDWLKSKF